MSSRDHRPSVLIIYEVYENLDITISTAKFLYSSFLLEFYSW